MDQSQGRVQTQSFPRIGGATNLALLLIFGIAEASVGHAADPPRPEPPSKSPKKTPSEQADKDATRLDAHGDPLPAGASARLGTVRLRAQVTAFAFSPDGQTLASVGGDSGLNLWQVSAGRKLEGLPLPNVGLQTVAFSADGKTLAASLSFSEEIAVYDFTPTRPGDRRLAALGKERLRIKTANGSISFLAFLPDDKLLAGAVDGWVTLCDATGKEIQRFGDRTERAVHLFALSPDGTKLAVGNGREANVKVWDVARGRRLLALAELEDVSSLAFGPDGKTLAGGGAKTTIRLWDLATGKVRAQLVGKKAPGQTSGHGDTINSLVFTPDGKTLASVGDHGDGTIRLWDVPSARERGQLKGQQGASYRLALAPDGKTLAVTGFNYTIHLWDLNTGKQLDANLGSQGCVCCVAVAPDGKEVATGDGDGIIRFWDLARQKQLRSFRAHRVHVHNLAYVRDGACLVSASSACEPARLWDLASGKEIRSFRAAPARFPSISRLCLSPDGKRLVQVIRDSGFPDNKPLVQLLDVATGKIERTLAQTVIDQLAFSPDSQLLVGGGMNCKLHLWDVNTGKEKWSVSTLNAITAVAFSPDGRLIAAATYSDEEILLWDAATGREVRRLKHRGGTVRALAFSRDSWLLAASGDSNGVWLYEASTGQGVRRLSGHGSSVWSLAFTPDGRSLVSGSTDTTALVWDLKNQELARTRQAPLTAAELEAHWTALGNPEARDAYQSVLSLANAPEQATRFLKTRLASIKPPDAMATAKWLEDLDNDDFEVREKASQALARLGKAVETELRRAQATTTSAEARKRLDELLEKLADQKTDEGVRGQRIVAALELAATEDAREWLGHLARSAATEELRRQAKRALERLADQPIRH